MKRREFLRILSQSAAVLILPSIARAICAPQNVLIAGGSKLNENTPCSGTTAQSDWLYRIGKSGNNPYADGVVWYHDFETKSEVDQFRHTNAYGNDPLDTGPRPNSVRWRNDDGIRGTCMEIWRAPGSEDPSSWWRPFSALDAGSTGRSEADPAANGTIGLKTFTPTSGGGQTRTWAGGFYGNPLYWGQYPGEFDGHEYYIQCRVKMDPNRIAGTNGNGGKIFYFTRTDRSLTSQEINTISGSQRGTPEQNYFDMYRSGGGGMDSDPPGISVHGNQPGTTMGTVGDGVCRYDNNGGRLANCWYWPSGEWVTVLYHVRGGTLVNGQLNTGNPDTLVEVKVARRGETEYTTIWNQPNIPLPFDLRPGHNSIICSGYMNGDATTINTGFYHRYCQLIFSKKFIPCPKV